MLHSFLIIAFSEHLRFSRKFIFCLFVVIAQISDIHVSVFHDPNRISEFRDFCNITIDAIKPTVVIASGKKEYMKLLENEKCL
jgi:hypothetical protein